MKKPMLLATLLLSLVFVSCEKEKDGNEIPDSMPRTTVPAELRGNWMVGKFSFTEYWSKNPGEYIDNALSLAIAFRFFENGTYEQYFTARSVVLGATTYHQSVTKGTVEIDPGQKTIITHPYKSHYRRTRSGVVEEDRDMKPSELGPSTYTYNTGMEPNGSKAIYLKLPGNSDPLTFINKP